MSVLSDSSGTLTGLMDMNKFRMVARDFLENVYDMDRHPTFIYFNIINMKNYNEKRGFYKGDLLLKYFANLLVDTFQDSLISHFFADQFVILAYDEGLEDKIERIEKDMESNISQFGRVAFKAGIYVYEPDVYVDIACDKAKLACDSIKKNSLVTCRRFDTDLEESNSLEQYVLSNFQEALDAGEVELYYQPIIRSINGSICYLEALARWDTKEKGMIEPRDFITVLEDHKMASRLDLYVINRVAEEFHTRVSIGLEPVPVSVNLSQVDFEYDGFIDKTMDAMDQHEIDRSLLVIELSESVVSSNPDMAKVFIEEFHQEGIEVWLDNFGRGYTASDVLSEFDFDLVKIDISSMEGFDDRGKGAKIVKDMASTVSSFGIRTLAEGVENEEQAIFLRRMGVDMQQGRFYRKPTPVRDYTKIIRDRSLISTETSEESKYYEYIESLDLSKPSIANSNADLRKVFFEIPVCVIESRNDECRVLKANQHLLDVIKSLDEDEEGYMCNDYMFKNPEITNAVNSLRHSDDWTTLNVAGSDGSQYSLWLCKIISDDSRNAFAAIMIITKE